MRDELRRALVLIGTVLAIALAWTVVRGGEVVILKTFDVQGKDLFTTLWVVDDAEFVWIRASRPDRKWLPHVEQNPNVELRREGRSLKYRALIYDDPEARRHIRPRYRAKYGLADMWREWVEGSDTIPIRLTPR